MNENVDYKAKSPSKSTKFLWWCAGADEKILMYCSYSDHVKYLGIGGVVLATAFMAALSMGFALHTIFGVTNPLTGEFEGNWFVTVPVALIWALIVFNLDRFIVSSTGKGDGESTISWSELGNAAPRLLMATLLGLTISAPLETTIFGSEIEREWIETKDQLVRKKSYEIEQYYLTRQNETEQKKTDKKKEVDDQIILVNKNQERVTKERQSGTGVQWQKDTKDLEVEQKKLQILRIQLDSIEKSTLSLIPLKAKAQDSCRNIIMKEKSGFLDKIMMLEKISAEGKKVPKFDASTGKIKTDSNGKVEEEVIVAPAFWAVWLVRLLFMIIEIAPVILKLMLIKSPYDYMGENVNQILEAKQGISMNHVTDEEGKLTKYKENYNPRRIIAIVEHQNAKEEENAKEAITLFAEKEKKEIANNPDAFINPNDSSN
jgi:hypothetical protein